MLKVIFSCSNIGIDLLERSATLSFSCPGSQVPFDKLVKGRFSSDSVGLARRGMVIISSASLDVRFYTRFLASGPSFGRAFERVDSANVRFGLWVSWLQIEKRS